MKQVLWISRHEMTRPQQQDLQRILGGPFTLVQWKENVTDVDSLAPLVEQADVIAAVLPTELLAKLWKLAGEKPLLQAVSGRIPTGKILLLPDGRSEPEYIFSHKAWQQILRLEIETKIL